MFLQSIFVSIISVIILMLLSRLRKRYGADTVHKILYSLVLLYVIPIGIIRNAILEIFSNNGQEYTGDIFDDINIVGRTMFASVENKESINIGTVTMSIIIGVCILLALHDIFKYLRILNILRRWNVPDINEKARRIFEECIHEFEIKSNVILLENDLVLTPMVMGIRRKYIILPSTVKLKDNTTIRNYMYHELTHIKNRDHEIGILMRVVEILNWYNPIIHILVKNEKIYCEFACDEEVIRDRDVKFKNEYVNAIADTVRWQIRKQLFYGKFFSSNAKIAKQRINAITNTESGKKGTYLLIVIIVTIITFSSHMINKISLENSILYKNCMSIIQREDINSNDYYSAIVNKILMELNKNTFSKYENYGIEVEESTGRLYYEGYLIRNFEDKRMFTKSVLYYIDGDIDLYIIRNGLGEISEIQHELAR